MHLAVIFLANGVNIYSFNNRYVDNLPSLMPQIKLNAVQQTFYFQFALRISNNKNSPKIEKTSGKYKKIICSPKLTCIPARSYSYTKTHAEVLSAYVYVFRSADLALDRIMRR